MFGVTAPGQQAIHAQPYATRYVSYLPSDRQVLMSGTEVHAHIIATLHDQAFIATPVWLSTLPLLLVLGGLLGHALSRLNLAWGFLVAFVHHWLWKVVAVVGFARFHWRIEVVPML